jgi:hypothetical protein
MMRWVFLNLTGVGGRGWLVRRGGDWQCTGEDNRDEFIMNKNIPIRVEESGV